MERRRSFGRSGVVACAAVVASLVFLAIATAQRPPTGTTARRGAARVGAASRLAAGAMILGTAWASDNSPIPAARVRLRRLPSGLIVGRAQADERGEYVFGPVEPGSYVIELVDERDRVLATGQIVSVEAGETVAVFVRLAARGPWLTELFGNAAAAAVSSAASLGITAVAPPTQAASPIR